MALRLIEARLPELPTEELERLGSEFPVQDMWADPTPGGRLRLRLLADAEDTQPILDELEGRYGSQEDFRLLLLPVEASLPAPAETEEEPEEETPAPGDEPPPGEAAARDAPEEAGPEPETAEGPGRIAREEIVAELSDSAELGPAYLLLVALSAVVCAFGLLRGDVAVIIGGMVIAPLLGPLVALSLAATLADGGLAWSGFKTGSAGVLLAFVLSVSMGLLVPVDPTLPEIARRTGPGLGDVGLALAAGSAGTLAFTTGAPAPVIGVMVAVALVPPLVAAGLLAGAGYGGLAAGAGVLTLVNLICINLAGVVTFLAQGIRPRGWWEAERARKSTTLAVVVWTLLLAALMALMLL